MGVGIAAVLLIAGYFLVFMKRDSAGEEYRLAARELVMEVEGYAARPDYYDWLVDYCHDQVFNDAVTMESRGRRRVDIIIDEDKYLRDLFHAMMEPSRKDGATGVSDALGKYWTKMQAEAQPPPAPSRPRR
jgi:hypothetical protein